MKKDSFGDRMKFYEGFETERRLMPLVPAVARMDGICFHNFCRGLKRPYDDRLSALMIELTMDLAKDFNVNCAYTQSDEISLAWNIDDYTIDMFCNGKVLKLTSHLAAKTSVRFNKLIPKYLPEKKEDAYFDARIMSLPNITEATNMFLWREKDAARNSVQMAGHTYFSQKEMHGKKNTEIQEMLWAQQKINWNDYPNFFKRGTFIIRKKVLKSLTEIVRECQPNLTVETVERNEFVKYDDMPSFSKVINREQVLFMGEKPETEALSN